MGRYIFDVFADKSPVTILPLNLIFRKRGNRKPIADYNQRFLMTIEANSYDEAIEELLEKLKRP